MVQTFLKTTEFPWLSYIDKVVDVLVVQVVLVPQVQVVQKTIEIPRPATRGEHPPRCLKSRLFRAARPLRVWALHLSAMWHRPRLWWLSRSKRLCPQDPRQPCSSRHLSWISSSCCGVCPARSRCGVCDAQTRGHVCTCLSRCRARDSNTLRFFRCSSYHKNSGVNCDSADQLGDNRGPLMQSIDKVVDIPVVAQRQILQTFQKTMVIPRLSSIDKVVDAQRQILQAFQRSVEIPRLSSIDKVVDAQRQILQAFQRSGGDSTVIVHRQGGRCAEADPPDVSEDDGDSTVIVHRQGGRCAEADPPGVSEDGGDSTVIVHRQGGRCPRRPGCAGSTGAGCAQDNRDPTACMSWRTSLRCLKPRLFRAAKPLRVWALHLSAMCGTCGWPVVVRLRMAKGSPPVEPSS